jgi:DNA-directed RNA polymerase sigma subunit (sigma70/sigma32)
MHEMRDELQRWPTMFELAANLGTTNIEGLKQFIAEGAECKRAAVYANLRLVVSITKRHNRTQKVSLSVRPLDRFMDF